MYGALQHHFTPKIRKSVIKFMYLLYQKDGFPNNEKPLSWDKMNLEMVQKQMNLASDLEVCDGSPLLPGQGFLHLKWLAQASRFSHAGLSLQLGPAQAVQQQIVREKATGS